MAPALKRSGRTMRRGYRPSRVRRRMPRRFWMARSSSPSFLAAQTNAQKTTASVNTLTAPRTIPRNVLIAETACYMRAVTSSVRGSKRSTTSRSRATRSL